ncbi:hypothetical protein QEJ31_14610 [Pigmentibacter sp. JX0631]|uniref:hypothetical protein n=1 Tax=Pigmentibacter sp. JX0631 TaxID=2976982 RepID=UPI0024695147|nr:hypothetical protein [Pigmentibacter sp. JX0631]WGL59761.1 hypothetical protein QEJ31_14610 [Pigmentibacter sp. JX0631]
MSNKIQSHSDNYNTKKPYSEKEKKKYPRKNTEENKHMSVEEIARKGGEATSAIHDKEHYRQMGLKAGELKSKKIRKQIYNEN